MAILGTERKIDRSTAANAAPVRRAPARVSYQRREDFYYQSVMLWLEVDQIIRTSSQGKRRLDSCISEWKPFTSDTLIAAIQTAASDGGQIALGIKSLGFSRSAQLNWSGGLGYANLRRNDAPPLLDAILTPSATP